MSELIFTDAGVSPPPTPVFDSSITFSIDDSGGATAHDFRFRFTATDINVKIIWGDGTSEVLYSANGGSNYLFSKNFQCPGVIAVQWGGGELTQLNIPSNNITEIHETDLSLLTYLKCDDNKLTSLDCAGAVELITLICNDNLLTSINIADSPLLDGLFTYNNQLEDTDISNNPATSDYVLSNNIFTVTAVSNALITLDNNGLLNGNFDSKNQTPAAPPNPAGVTAANNLIGKVWSIVSD